MVLQLHQTQWNAEDAGREGYWGVATASIDWCEANYVHSFYVAELFNSVSNVAFCLLAVYGGISAINQRLPKRFFFGFLLLMLVGLGSSAFHATLTYSMQLLDELPMIYHITFLSWIVFDLTPIQQNSSLKTPIFLPCALFSFDVLFTFAYLYLPNPVFHQIAFGALVCATFFRGAWLLKTQLKGHKNMKQARKLLVIGSSLIVLAFAIWNADNLLCNSWVTPMKKRLGPGFSWLLEGHQWWHIFVGSGAYASMQALAFITLSVRDSPEHYRLVYVGGVLPVVKRTAAGWATLKQTEGTVEEAQSLLPDDL